MRGSPADPEAPPFAGRPVPLRVAGTGRYLPPRLVTAADVDARTGMPAGWTIRRTGVESRHYVDVETASEMGAAALREAVGASAWGDARPDLLIGASGTMQQPIPCTAALIAGAMGWHGVPCFDVNSTCLSFVTALQVAGGLVANGSGRRVAVVSTEIASKGLDWTEPESAGLMGDGAAAVLLEAGADGGSSLIGTMMETWPEGATLTEIRGGGSRLPATEFRPESNRGDFLFHMDGPAVFRLAASRIEDFLDRFLPAAPDRWNGIDWVVPHQASLPALQRFGRLLGIPTHKMVETVRSQGNVIAASIPLALHDLVTSGRLQRGQTVLLVGTSAGLSIGAALLRY